MSPFGAGFSRGKLENGIILPIFVTGKIRFESLGLEFRESDWDLSKTKAGKLDSLLYPPSSSEPSFCDRS